MNKSWRQHPTKQQLYGHSPGTMKIIQVRRTRHTGHCCRSRSELISYVLLWTPSHGRTKAGRPTRTYIQQLCVDTEWIPEDLPEAMDDGEQWRERDRDIRADGTELYITAMNQFSNHCALSYGILDCSVQLYTFPVWKYSLDKLNDCEVI